MIAFTSHLDDDRLFDCYLATRAGEALDPPLADHLADCPSCAAHFDAITKFMDEVREDADAEVDAIFTPDRLAHQQQQIARRLEAVGRSARVIHFPVHGAPRQLPPAGTRTLPRWVAAAAAAGLFAGVGAGMFFDRTRTMRAPAVAAVEPLRVVTPVARPVAPVVDRDDAFLSELEMAAGGPRTAELAAYDALTPHIREISVSMPIR